MGEIRVAPSLVLHLLPTPPGPPREERLGLSLCVPRQGLELTRYHFLAGPEGQQGGGNRGPEDQKKRAARKMGSAWPSHGRLHTDGLLAVHQLP